MATEGVDKDKRRFLTASTAVVGAVGAGFVAVPFIASWSPSERAKTAGAPVEVDISKLQDGQKVTVEWRGKPVWIVKRTQKSLDELATLDDGLRDPASENVQQPAYAQNPSRSIKPEILVLVGICTHLGCSPTYRPELGAADLGADWKGGFFCPCHGSKFDLAGRVYSGVPAPLNLEVPPHFYKSDRVILIGEDGGAA
ncbi:MAG: ubiquinol-cytochrome c reductase iron-sulfur subunit [Gammaproteobacteria bacterium]|nr:ubiquinol-cytochrome c reductase iron-sulfur subunit [Gammaproteobacteria bacterium]MCW8910831.1 ubiquinol-cytochrome c reductase iron-sulfur subunit [Gammaproteobacteria bacterium]MCW9004121.1 ubiquinol-cytochrome c reductase iron-sulfur subunit [Gammaproteobacteria bacterium]MCW9055228.1 ubiquinol-cytochrome c reductase iron-sulfur subunit [Gammaproteobacteria bacterium]